MTLQKRKTKNPKTLRQWLIPKLRNHSRIWPPKKQARMAAKRKIRDGFFKNGNPRFCVKFECAICHGLFDIKQTQMDHILPVVDITGFTTWDEFITSLFCEAAGYQCLCEACHIKKTQEENISRAAIRKEKKSNEIF